MRIRKKKRTFKRIIEVWKCWKTNGKISYFAVLSSRKNVVISKQKHDKLVLVWMVEKAKQLDK